MSIERVTAYRTSDGKEFNSRTIAERHQLEIDSENALAAILDSAVRTMRVDAVLRALVVHAPEVREILTSFLRRQPKMSKQLTAQRQVA